MSWSPMTYAQTWAGAVLPITNPPCATCSYWLPQPVFHQSAAGAIVADGVILCHADKQSKDFTCYVEKAP
jgi:hypothetical protein